MIVEIALCVGAGALAVVAGLLVPLLIQLRKPVVESEYLLVHNRLVEHAAVLLHAAGRLRDTVQRVHETVRGTSRSFLVHLVSMVAKFKATTGVVKTHIHREGGTINGK